MYLPTSIVQVLEFLIRGTIEKCFFYFERLNSFSSHQSFNETCLLNLVL